MNLYRVVSGILVIGSGQVLKLAADQAKARAHKLIPAASNDQGVYEAAEPLQFIVGEELGIADLQMAQQPFVVAIGGEVSAGRGGVVGERDLELVKPAKASKSK